MNTVLVCWRHPLSPESQRRYIDTITSLVPNATGQVDLVVDEPGMVLIALGAPDSTNVQEGSVALGIISSADGDWWKVGGHPLETAHAALRTSPGSPETVEVLTDILGSRTVWFARTDNLFMASTAIRPVVALLGSFEPDPNAARWMLTSGTLGPGQSWDRRVRPVPPDSRLVFSRASWSLEISTEKPDFTPTDASEEGQLERLRTLLPEQLRNMQFDGSKWAISLSGGIDSRAILAAIEENSGIRSVTWGKPEAIEGDAHNDAVVAEQLASRFHLKHEFLPIEPSAVPVTEALERFIVNGEGRIDHFSGYIDGMALWDRIFDTGIRGLLRGDQVFGWYPFNTKSGLRASINATVLSDLMLPPAIATAVQSHWAQEQWPAELAQSPEESLAEWRERVYQAFRVPVGLAALTQVKSGYTDTSNPLLSRSLVCLTRSLQDELRTDKAILRKFVVTLTPGIDVATGTARESLGEIIRHPDLMDEWRNSLEALAAGDLVPAGLVAHVKAGLDRQPSKGSRSMKLRIRSLVRNLVPKGMRKARAMRTTARPPEVHQLALRLHIIRRMNEMLNSDAELLAAQRP